ncbi:unnamed protein product, partial [Meganyctiphanes norvegica]
TNKTMGPLFSVGDEIKLIPWLCFICQKSKKDVPTYKTSIESILKLKNVAAERKSHGDKSDTIERADKYLQGENTIQIKCHKTCYGSFTNKEHIDRLVINTKQKKVKQESNNVTSNGTVTRSKVPAFNYALCAFCQVHLNKELKRMSQMDISSFVKENAKFNPRLFMPYY